ncbi:vitamin B12-dependent ribonucleotide reductase [Proteinivorax hydrogeniformans]|uniref:Vitamin B12-dependent ribonucleotide reductase n=1 Tax=Proteinivorax hydrogeniformans TaxID=1826727 RepID=A0AAU8HTR3_9FIRM
MGSQLKLSANALTVLEKRYLTKENTKVVEKPEEMFRRVAKNIANVEKEFGTDKESIKEVEEKFYELMVSLDFLPNSPTLMNAGKDLQQLAACFVLPVEDSMESIFETIKNAALIHKSGGGTGFSFSRLRPANDRVQSTGGVASGPISFMKVFNSATEVVKQGGTRRGANMAILRVDHPDILEFITAKEKGEELTNFNISIGLTEEFMDAVMDGRDYPLINPQNGKVVKRISAAKVFGMIVEAAHKNGEPGIVFLDRINDENPTPNLGEIESTNPCGEQPLLPYEACNLGSINLSNMVKEGELDFERLKKTVELSVRFLDNTLQASKYPLEKIKQMVRGNRKIGLGVMGFADCLIKLKIPYDSEKAINMAEKIMEFIQYYSKECSQKLAQDRGAFPNFADSLYSQKGIEIRNATTTTIAPTGTISIISGVSSGVEPLFAVCYKRNVLDNESLVEVHPLFEQIAKERDFYSEELMEKIAQKGSVAGVLEVPEDVQKLFVTAHEISPRRHIEIQSAFQRHTDNAVSKTVNFKSDATKEDISEVFIQSYKLKCKGVTVYRDGSRDAQVLTVGDKKKSDSMAEGVQPRPRPSTTFGTTVKKKIGCGNLYISVNSDQYGICEVFTNTGRQGGCASQSEATSRLVSIALRAGVDKDTLVEQLKGIRCPACIRRNGIEVTSCPDAIAKAIDSIGTTLKNQGSIEEVTAGEANENKIVDKCPECGKKVRFESGCNICPHCGYSKCG